MFIGAVSSPSLIAPDRVDPINTMLDVCELTVSFGQLRAGVSTVDVIDARAFKRAGSVSLETYVICCISPCFAAPESWSVAYSFPCVAGERCCVRAPSSRGGSVVEDTVLLTGTACSEADGKEVFCAGSASDETVLLDATCGSGSCTF